MRKKILIPLAVILLLVKSCYYMDGSTYFEEISYDSIPNIEFITNFDNIDSIVITDSILFQYTVDIDTADLYAVDLFFSNYWIYSSKLVEDSLYIGPFALGNDQYRITMQASYKTHTGSVADIYGIERKIISRDWVITLDNPLK